MSRKLKSSRHEWLLPENAHTLMLKYLDRCTRFFLVVHIAEENEVAFVAFSLRHEIEFQNYLYSVILKHSRLIITLYV